MRSWAGLILCMYAAVLNAEPVAVTVQPLEQLWQQRQHDAPATVVSLNSPQISAEIDAVVSTVKVNTGDIVEAGDILVELDCSSYNHQQQVIAAGLQRAEAQLHFAQSQLSRARNLKNTKSISDELLDQRVAELKTAQAEKITQQERLLLADIDVSHCSVVSPFKAVVTERLVSEGAYATKGTALLSLTDIDKVEVSVRLLNDEINSLKEATFTWLKTHTKEFSLQLRSIVSVFDEKTATAEGRLIFNETPKAWPGSVGRLVWASDSYLLPAGYLVRRNGKLGIFYVKNKQAFFHQIISALEGRPAKISLPPDTLVVVEGRQRLQDGDAVTIRQEQDNGNL